MFERRLYHHIDWALVIAIIALCAFGVATIYSATFDPTRGASHRYVVQLYAIALGLLAMLVMLTIDYRAFTDKSHLIYIAILAVLVTSYLTGITLFGAVTSSAGVALPPDVTSLSGVTISPAGLALRLLGTVAYIVISMVGVAAIALFLSTVTDSALGAAMGALAVLVTSQVLVTLDAAAAIRPYLPTRYWLAWIDFFREPVLWRDIERGAGIQLVYLVVLLGAAWANFLTKDVAT